MALKIANADAFVGKFLQPLHEIGWKLLYCVISSIKSTGYYTIVLAHVEGHEIQKTQNIWFTVVYYEFTFVSARACEGLQCGERQDESQPCSLTLTEPMIAVIEYDA